MESDKIHDEPSAVETEGEAVRMRGPAKVDIRFTPDAAEETSQRLLEGAMKVRGQRYFDEN